MLPCGLPEQQRILKGCRTNDEDLVALTVGGYSNFSEFDEVKSFLYCLFRAWPKPGEECRLLLFSQSRAKHSSDLLLNIFFRLPPQQLSRFLRTPKCVHQ